MRKKIPVSMLAGLMLLAAVAAFNISYIVIWNIFSSRLATLNVREAAFMKLSEVAAYVDEYYISDADPDRLLDGAAAGYLEALPDDASYFVPADALEAWEAADESGHTGIGIIASANRELGGINVLDMYEGSTAAEFGIERFDVITAIDSVPVVQYGFENAMGAMRGEEGTTVDLTVFRPRTNETLVVNVRRGAVINERPLAWRMLSDTVGYIRVDYFDRGTDAEFRTALTSLQDHGARALVLDVRTSPGGYMDVMTAMADPLMGSGIIYTERRDGGETTEYFSDEDTVGLPVAVLIGEYTSGAGEYFAAALREGAGAKLLGTATAGTGYAQTRIDLSDGSVMILSTVEYYTPEGNPLQGVGLQPDLEIPASEEERLLQGEDEDPLIIEALRILG